MPTFRSLSVYMLAQTPVNPRYRRLPCVPRPPVYTRRPPSVYALSHPSVKRSGPSSYPLVPARIAPVYLLNSASDAYLVMPHMPSYHQLRTGESSMQQHENDSGLTGDMALTIGLLVLLIVTVLLLANLIGAINVLH
ncbi:MAG: hypothetical protein NVS4B2_15090 [Chloroflexota bacterium]